MDIAAIDHMLDEELSALDEDTRVELEELRMPIEEEEISVGAVYMFAEVEPGVRLAWFPLGNPEPDYCWAIVTEEVDGTWNDETWCDSLEDCHYAAVNA